MEVDLGIWDKLTRLVLFLVVIAALIGVFFWYLPLFRENEARRKDILRLEMKVKKEEETARQLEAMIKALRNDPKTVERAARERLGYAKPGETVIYFEASTNK